MLLLRRNQLNLDAIAAPLAQAAADIHARLMAPTAASPPGAGDTGAKSDPALRAVPEDLPDPFEQDISPWVMRRLALAVRLAASVRGNADLINAQLAAPATPTT